MPVDETAAALRALAEVGHGDAPQAVLDRAVSAVASVLDAVVVARWSAAEGAPPVTAAAGVAVDAGAAGQSAMAQADDFDGPWRTVIDPANEPLLAGMSASKATVLGVPLRGPGEGVLLVARTGGRGEEDAADELVATAVADQICIALAALAFGDERRRLQDELRTAERLKTEFVAMTSHELRTPLTSIRAATSMVHSYWDTITEERKMRLLEVIEGQAQRLSRLVENILAAANIEAGVVLPRITTVDLAAAADDVARDFAAELDVVVDCERPLITEADPDHMRQILVNFVGNSLKYGKPPVGISGRHVRDRIELRVTDEGQGVPEYFVPRLFDRFTQASSGDSRHASGSGLGLSIVKGLAEASGGTVHYEPRKPHGACFVLTLPVT